MSISTCFPLSLDNLEKQKIWWLRKEGASQDSSFFAQEGWESEVCIRKTLPWSDPLPQQASATKALLPSLFKGFLKRGGSPPPLLPRALCRCHILHRALGLPPDSAGVHGLSPLSCPMARDSISPREGLLPALPVRCFSKPSFQEHADVFRSKTCFLPIYTNQIPSPCPLPG